MSEQETEQKGVNCPQCHSWVKSVQNTCARCGWQRGQKPEPKPAARGYAAIPCSIEDCPQNGTFAGPDGRRYCEAHEIERIERDRLARHGLERPTFAKHKSPPL